MFVSESVPSNLIARFLKRHWRFSFLAIAIAAVIGWAGCRKNSTGVTVTGNVSYRSQPLSSGSVTFFPTTGRPVNGPLSSDGSYSLTAEPGEYAVCVSASEPLPPGFKEGDPMPKPKVVLPDQYTVRAKSTLTATVTAGQDAPIDFDLK